MKKRRVLIAGILVAAMALTGILAATVAADTDNDGTRPRDTIMARVAELLGVDQSDVESAFTQALQEEREQRQQEMEAAREARLQGLIDEGVLTQDQVDEWEAWLEARPDTREAMQEWMESRPDLGIDSGEFGRPGGFDALGRRDGMRGGMIGRGPTFSGQGFGGNCPMDETVA
jgi:hypothetical protein